MKQTISKEAWIRGLLLGVGSLCLALGVIGVFVPLLPTTPFLLVAAACFFRSSPRLYDWLLRNRLLGGYIRHYREGGGIPLRAKIISLTLLWLTISYSTVFVVEAWWLRGLLLAIAVGVTVHIVTRRPRRP